ncbi:DUF4124 domain-containing protein [Roseateles koreensis]|uniref:DUF4124 domain-containing protein n=1 Tax=Roseateles koreensis TaxID=2987526 RepID=A0ABT5KLV2_9BURK|nr:DUF4124 domain-containing protein [Roseateles koreensis]MDC8783807.1 DUF4124 domain-containing protein [Roseateles koreensis]
MLRPTTFTPTQGLCRLAALSALGALLFCSALPANAQWKWRDAAGNWQFSDLPPPSTVPEKDILRRPANAQAARIVVVPYGVASPASPPAPDSAASGPSKDELKQQAKEKQLEKDKLAKQREQEQRQAEQRAANCRNAQDNLRLLESGVRLKRSNEAGEPVVIDDAQREAEMQSTRGVIHSECR